MKVGEIMGKIDLIEFTDKKDNYELMYKWCSKEFIYEWFEQRKLSYEEIENKYKNKLLANQQQLFFINYNDNKIGFVQIYKYDDKKSKAFIKYDSIYEYDEDISNFLIEFSRATEDASNNVSYYKILGLEHMNKINITCIPWITFSNFKDAIDFNEKNSKPKICWGKYYLDDDRYLIDISLLVNHAFQDGYHMGLFFNNLQQNIYNLKVNKNLVKVRW